MELQSAFDNRDIAERLQKGEDVNNELFEVRRLIIAAIDQTARLGLFSVHIVQRKGVLHDEGIEFYPMKMARFSSKEETVVFCDWIFNNIASELRAFHYDLQKWEYEIKQDQWGFYCDYDLLISWKKPV